MFTTSITIIFLGASHTLTIAKPIQFFNGWTQSLTSVLVAYFADYNGDGKTDLAVYRNGVGLFYDHQMGE